MPAAWLLLDGFDRCFPRRARSYGEREAKRRSLADHAFCAHIPAMRADDFLRDGQTQPHTGFLILTGRAIKLLKQMLQFFLGDALSGVFHKKHHAILLLLSPNGHRASRAGESEGV